MIRGADCHRIDVVTRQQFAEVGISLAILVRIALVDRLPCFLNVVFVDVAGGHDQGVGFGHERFHVERSLPTDADAAHDDAIAGRDASVKAKGRSRDNSGKARSGRDSRNSLDKVPSADTLHSASYYRTDIVSASSLYLTSANVRRGHYKQQQKEYFGITEVIFEQTGGEKSEQSAEGAERCCRKSIRSPLFLARLRKRHMIPGQFQPDRQPGGQTQKTHLGSDLHGIVMQMLVSPVWKFVRDAIARERS